MIEIRNLSKVYESDSGSFTALNNVNLTVNDGDIYGIIGLSGAGKSTLVRCINFLERPTSGELLIDGENLFEVTDDRLREIRRKVTMIFQQFNLLQQRNVLKNVELAGEISNKKEGQSKGEKAILVLEREGLAEKISDIKGKKAKERKAIKILKQEGLAGEIAGGDKTERREKAIRLLETVGLGDKLNSYPSELSGGQQQRVAIARALMTDPKVLLCDEATSALDPETTRSILELLKELNKKLGLTIIIISHQMSVIEAVCNKVAIIDNSEIVADGDLQDVFLSPQAPVAKRLIYSGRVHTGIKGEKFVKLMFDGEIEQPVITNIIQQCDILLSVYYAETKVINDKTYGQIIFRLPYYEEDVKKLNAYLDKEGIAHEEVDSDELY